LIHCHRSPLAARVRLHGAQAGLQRFANGGVMEFRHAFPLPSAEVKIAHVKIAHVKIAHVKIAHVKINNSFRAEKGSSGSYSGACAEKGTADSPTDRLTPGRRSFTLEW
jgi:hypothetical protein